MAVFPAAYKKVFVGSLFLTSGKTEDYSYSQFGFFDAKTWTAIGPSEANVTDHPQIVLAQGSFHNSDQIGGGHGGYQESVKSEVIRPHQIHRFWKVSGRSAKPHIVQLGWNGTSSSTSPQFMCGQNYTLRIDLKGSPGLRFLGHNLFREFDVFTGCCADPDSPTAVDPIFVLLEFAKLINTDPVYSYFISADVLTTDGGDAGTDPDVVNPATYVPLTDPSAIASAIGALRLTVAYSDTQFTDCSFDPRDHVNMEPLVIAAAQLVDETGAPCPSFKQLVFTEKQAARPADGTGAQVLRDLIESYNYRQEVFQTDPRKSEIELSLTAMAHHVFVDSLYDSYYILHSVNRKSNPSGIYDNDYYLIQVSVPHSNSMTEFIALVNNYIASARPGLQLEDLSGDQT